MSLVNFESVGIDRHTGRPLTGWAHVVQSLEVLFSTGFGERIMREWVGSFVPAVLGRNMVPATILAAKTAIFVAIALFEPRYRIIRITSLSVDRMGRYVFQIEGEYRPRGHHGDTRAEGRRTVTLGRTEQSGIRVAA